MSGGFWGFSCLEGFSQGSGGGLPGEFFLADDPSWPPVLEFSEGTGGTPWESFFCWLFFVSQEDVVLIGQGCGACYD